MIWIVAYVSSVVGAVMTLIALTVMRDKQRHSLGRIGWLGLILLSPPVGLVLFLWLGGRRISHEHQHRETVDLPGSPGETESVVEPNDDFERLLRSRRLRCPTEGNRIELVESPVKFHQTIFELVRSATEHVYIMTFILDESDANQKLMELLCQKARDGVRVRLLVDGFGSFHLPNSFLEPLQQAGGEAARFKPMARFGRLTYVNFRNHRKLAVADGEWAVLGGANLDEPEFAAQKTDDSWVDLSLSIRGPAVVQLQAVFQNDWKFATDRDLPRQELNGQPTSGDSRLTVVPIGPDGPQEVLDDFWQFAIHHAEDVIRICTPYFVPPPHAMRSLELACRRGVQLKILVPDRSDLWPVDYARYDFLNDLCRLGAQVYRYPDRMVHTKAGIVDDKMAIVGSANFDVRSFFLNYELSCVIHDRPTIVRIRDWFEETAECCETDVVDHSVRRSVMSSLVRLFATEL